MVRLYAYLLDRYLPSHTQRYMFLRGLKRCFVSLAVSPCTYTKPSRPRSPTREELKICCKLCNAGQVQVCCSWAWRYHLSQCTIVQEVFNYPPLQHSRGKIVPVDAVLHHTVAGTKNHCCGGCVGLQCAAVCLSKPSCQVGCPLRFEATSGPGISSC